MGEEKKAILGCCGLSILFSQTATKYPWALCATTASSSLSSQFNLIDKVHSKIIIIIIQKSCSSEIHAMHRRRQARKCLGAKLIQFWVPADAWLLIASWRSCDRQGRSTKQAKAHNRDQDGLIASLLIAPMRSHWNVYGEINSSCVISSDKKIELRS